jgi:protein-S-isoprenylcysteine O-methyltransferase Ste14
VSGRGAAWAYGQFAVMAAVLALGFVPPDWPDGAQGILTVAGTVLGIAGGAIAVWAARTMGRSLTPFPKPVPAGLVTSGPFAVVRHPVYAGGILFFTGYALFSSIPALAATVVLAVVWAAKSRLEERLLAEVYDGYGAYRKAVRWRIVPLVY